MSGLAPMQRPVADGEAAVPEHLDLLIEHLGRNRFLPQPPPGLMFVGDGDYRAIGGEFLRHFVRLGGLGPEERVLDIGCGVGRMAVPLTQYLTGAAACYDGVDIVAEGIDWCRRHISSAYPAFRFHHLDRHHPIYNPDGRTGMPEPMPFATGQFTFVIATSVFTHLGREDMLGYVAEIARLLDRGGRCFLSLFLMNGRAREHLGRAGAPLPFDPAAAGPEFTAYADSPTAAVAYDEDFLVGAFARAGLKRVRPTVYGRWCGRTAASFQDLCVFGKAS